MKGIEMAHIRNAKLVCDACGSEIEIDPSIDTPFGSSLTVRESNYSGWCEVKGKHLCDSCYREYLAMRAEQEEAIAKRFKL